MIHSDTGRRVRIFDRPGGKGLVGVVISVLSDTTFRFKTDPNEKYPDGKEFEFSTEGKMAVQVQFLEGS